MAILNIMLLSIHYSTLKQIGRGARMSKNKDKNEQLKNIDFDTLSKMDFGQLIKFLGSLNPEQAQNLFNQLKIDPNDERFQLRDGDPRLNFLYSLKSFVPPENAKIIDQIIATFKK